VALYIISVTTPLNMSILLRKKIPQNSFKGHKVHYFKWNTLYIIMSLNLLFEIYRMKNVIASNRTKPVVFKAYKLNYFKWDLVYIIM